MSTPDGFGSGPAADPVQRCPLQQSEHWIEIELNDDDGQPMSGVAYRVKLPDGQVVEGCLDAEGRERLSGLRSGGACEVCFPELDETSWELDQDPPTT